MSNALDLIMTGRTRLTTPTRPMLAGSLAKTPVTAARPVSAGHPSVEAAHPTGVARLGLSEQARSRLEEMIVSLVLAPGSISSEAELSAMLGIGRTPVREALQRLEGDHLVKILPRHGAQITEINVVQQLLLLELRRELDRSIARHAARRSTVHERTQLLEIAARLESRKAEGDNILLYLRDHYELKNFLAACARNPFVAKAVMPCYALSRRFYYLHHRRARDLATATRHHGAVIRAVAIGDARKAADASDRLLDYVEEFTRATVTDRL